MTHTGRLTIRNEDSRLDSTLLARKGAPDPFGAATSFLRNLGLRDGDCITVSGEDGTIGSVSVIFMDNASKADESQCVEAAAAPEMMAVRSVAAIKGITEKRPKAKTAKKKKPTTAKGGKAVKKTRGRKTVQRPKSKKRKTRRRG